MLSARSWAVARRYALPPLLCGAVLVAARQRAALLFLAGAGMILAFFRDPDRPLDPDPQLVYAAADGYVTDVGRAEAPWLQWRDGVRISTFLSLHNVHVTRSPIAGQVVRREDLDGRLAPALSTRAAQENRQSRLSIHGPEAEAGVVLVAGALARRITSWVNIGDQVRAGVRLGLIHFGSRVDVIMPAGQIEPLVRRGDRVVGGRTPIARILTSAAQ
jgi:phosphatidylserine decarboxylase